MPPPGAHEPAHRPGPEPLVASAEASRPRRAHALHFLHGGRPGAALSRSPGANICNWFPESGWAFPNGLTNAGLLWLRRDGARRLADGDRRMAADDVRPDGAPRLRHRLRLVEDARDFPSEHARVAARTSCGSSIAIVPPRRDRPGVRQLEARFEEPRGLAPYRKLLLQQLRLLLLLQLVFIYLVDSRGFEVRITMLPRDTDNG